MKPVLFVVTMGSATGRYGGPFDVAVSQSRLLRSWGIESKLVSGYFKGDRAQLPDDHYTQFILHGSHFGTPTLFSISAARTIFQQMRLADTAHVAFARELVPLYTVFVARLLKKNIIIQPHGMLTVGKGRLSFVDPLVERLLRDCRAVVALTETEALQLRERFPKMTPNILVAGNPPEASISRVETHGKGKPQVLFLARLHPRKRVADFITMARSATSLADFVVVGPDNGDLTEVLSAHRDGIITYEGALPGTAVPSRIAQADLLVLPAHDEPWSTTLVTAIHSGVPVLVHESAALARVIARSGAGVSYSNKGDEMLDALIKSLSNISQMSEKCKDLANSEFSKAHIEGQLRGVYRALYKF